ncbi:MAG: outer membrane beta-barrel protein [Hymenobacteraceae bacterium]|nr:outer membrane beta-barrel protein [Hymenobacteraceae bacterium]
MKQLKLRHFTLGIAATFLFPLTTLAQEAATVRGKVQESAQQEPVAYATVALLTARDSAVVSATVADTLGLYSLQAPKAAQYLLRVNFVGYRTYQSQPFSLETGETLEHPIIQLLQDTKLLTEVEVSAQKPMLDMLPGKLIYHISENTSLVGMNANEILETAPGVTADRGQLKLNGRPNVEIWINGRRRGGDTKSLLSGIPYASIEKVELISNPSAHYDASGSGGIINIILKKNTDEGFNGEMSGSLTQGHFLQNYSAFVWNFKKGNLNLYGDARYNRYRSYNKQSNESNYTTGPFKRQVASSTTELDSKTPSGLLGFDLQLTPKHRLGGEWWGMAGNSHSMRNSSTTSRSKEGNLLLNRQDNSNQNDLNYLTFNLNYEYSIDSTGKKLRLDGNYIRYDFTSAGTFENDFLNRFGQHDRPPYTLYSHVPTISDLYTAQADYVWPLKQQGAQLDAGLKFSSNRTGNNVSYEILRENVRSYSDSLSSHNQYLENIAAAYLNFTRPLGKWSMQAGLRAEYTAYTLDFISDQEQVQDSYLSLFPNISLSRQVGEAHTFSYSASRRIQRQLYEYMNPYVQFQGEYQVTQGNPYARPSYAYHFEVQHAYNYKYFTSVAYTYTDDILVMASELLPGTNITKISMDNLARMHNYSLTMSVPVSVKPWWSIANNLSGFASKYSSGSELPLYNSNFNYSYSFSSRNSFKLPADWNVNLSGFITGPSVTGALRYDTNWRINSSISKKFWDGKGSVSISAQDIFNTQEYAWHTLLKGGETYTTQKPDSRRVSLNLSYKFGNTKIRRKYVQKSSAEHQTRIGSRSQ